MQIVIAKASFVNSVVGGVTKRQRLTVPEGIAYELESMGLVEFEKQPMTVPQSAESAPLDDGREAPSLSLPAGQALLTDNLPKPKRGRPKKAGKSLR